MSTPVFQDADVTNSVMPKGVEQLDKLAPASINEFVSNSVMPKGVEHVKSSQTIQRGASDEFSDAERR